MLIGAPSHANPHASSEQYDLSTQRKKLQLEQQQPSKEIDSQVANASQDSLLMQRRKKSSSDQHGAECRSSLHQIRAHEPANIKIQRQHQGR